MELARLACKITSLKFVECGFFYAGVYYDIRVNQSLCILKVRSSNIQRKTNLMDKWTNLVPWYFLRSEKRKSDTTSAK